MTLVVRPPPRRATVTNPRGPQGSPGVDAIRKRVSTSVTKSRVMALDVANPGKVRSIVGAVGAAFLRFAGMSTADASANAEQAVQHAGSVDPADATVDPGLATAIGWDAAGQLVRVTDPTCVSGLRQAGWCDTAGTIYLGERTAKRYEWDDYGLVNDDADRDGTDNYDALVAMLAAMKRDAIAAGSLNKVQRAHFDGHFYFRDTAHIQQGVVLEGEGDGDPLLYSGYWWSPGTQFRFPKYVHGLRLHSQGDFNEYNPSGVELAAIESVSNPNGGAVTITTTAPHGLSTGARVYVGIVYYGQADLRDIAWAITVTGPTTFTLDGAVGDGTATTGTKVIGTTLWTNPGAGGGYPSASRSRGEGITLVAPFNDVCGQGIRSTIAAALSHVHVEGFGSVGIAMVGDHTSNGGNSNGWTAAHITIGPCGLDGFLATGGDANAGSLINGNIALTYGHGVHDAYNLGNTYINVQCAGCGSGGNENGPFVDFRVDGNAATTLLGCYSEIHLSIVMAPALVLGGNLASNSRLSTGSTALVLDGPDIVRGDLSTYDLSTGSLLRSYLGSRDGSGAFAVWLRENPAAYIRWKLYSEVVYAELSGSSSARIIGLPFGANAIRTGLGIGGYAPLMQHGIAHGEVGAGGAAAPRFDDFGDAPPTDGNRKQGDRRTNTAPTVVSDPGGDYVIDHWRCIADAVHTGPGETAADYDGGTWIAVKGFVA